MAGDQQTILVVEDEQAIASFVAAYLRKDGFTVRMTASGREALAIVGVDAPSLVVLDLMLPDLDGIEVCRRIRETSTLPVLMLTARDDDLDKIAGLEVGADDYLTKPFNPRELVARVRAILRRSGAEDEAATAACSEHGELVLDAGRRECHVGEEEIRLAPKEFDLLWELLDHKGLVLTRDQLLERVWGYTFAGDTRTVDVHVRQLRRKLGDAAPIVTVWGIGYKAGPRARRRRVGRLVFRSLRFRLPALFLLGIVLAGRRRDAHRGAASSRATPARMRRRSCARSRRGSCSSTRRRRASGTSPSRTSSSRSAATRCSGFPAVPGASLSPARCPSCPSSVLPSAALRGGKPPAIRPPRAAARHYLGVAQAGQARRRSTPGRSSSRSPSPRSRSRWLQLVWRARARVRDRDSRRRRPRPLLLAPHRAAARGARARGRRGRRGPLRRRGAGAHAGAARSSGSPTRFDEMTARLAESEQLSRNFLMSVSHELRTPLTAIRGHVVRAARGRVRGRGVAAAVARGRLGGGDAARAARRRRPRPRQARRAPLRAPARGGRHASPLRARLRDLRRGGARPAASSTTSSSTREPCSSPTATGCCRSSRTCSRTRSTGRRRAGASISALGAQNGEVTVAVADTGPGIAPELEERIFRPFWSRRRRRHGPRPRDRARARARARRPARAAQRARPRAAASCSCYRRGLAQPAA